MSTRQIEKHLHANMTDRKRDIMVANFLGGLAWGLGTVIGATVIVAILFAVLKPLNFLPGIDTILEQMSSIRK